jgi:hypothetical protein
MQLLAQFLLRLAFGLAFGMAITSPRQVSSGYFRNHLYVTLGLCTLAALALAQVSRIGMLLSIVAAALSYLGSACWLYESPRMGRAALWLVAASGLAAALIGQSATESPASGGATALRRSAVATSGLVLGTTTAAMLLGHWYLNAPGMDLSPLRRLLAAAALAVVLQALVSTIGLVAQWNSGQTVPLHWVLLRWSFGLAGVFALVVMAWQTLKIPNTQSATGILYVAVIGAFVGELASSLLSARSAFPL